MRTGDGCGIVSGTGDLRLRRSGFDRGDSRIRGRLTMKKWSLSIVLGVLGVWGAAAIAAAAPAGREASHPARRLSDRRGRIQDRDHPAGVRAVRPGARRSPGEHHPCLEDRPERFPRNGGGAGGRRPRVRERSAADAATRSSSMRSVPISTRASRSSAFAPPATPSRCVPRTS